ncbi:hypothetical protein EAX61_12240 [Dokdonia sinensis]|uniref:DUF4142 domain-containing protein n=1 Tax=Dokdonia sinensis TaxID=2479847 RepID=A0A3M0G5R5_9FLAO|nr:hypothetical protein [Dokdonia sinensis]RMB57133.1 hypothetical protein EAX61_12240 [Dokdonia sinensis]
MKKSLTILTGILFCILLNTQDANAQFGLKKLKNDAVKGLKSDVKKKKDSIQRQLVLGLLEKTTSFCKNEGSEKVVITSQSVAYPAYTDLRKELDALETNLLSDGFNKSMVKRIKKIGEHSAAVFLKEPNADLSTECTRLSRIQESFLSSLKL